jgi:hypothetical protein
MQNDIHSLSLSRLDLMSAGTFKIKKKNKKKSPIEYTVCPIASNLLSLSTRFNLFFFFLFFFFFFTFTQHTYTL